MALQGLISIRYQMIVDVLAFSLQCRGVEFEPTTLGKLFRHAVGSHQNLSQLPIVKTRLVAKIDLPEYHNYCLASDLNNW